MAIGRKVWAVMAFGVSLLVGCDSQKKGDMAAEPTDFAGQMTLAKKGNVAAAYNVAVCYMAGNGVASNVQAGVEWMAKAAMHGDTDAQFNLGVMYANGMGVLQSGVDSIRWYRMSAAQGGQEAQDRLKELGLE